MRCVWYWWRVSWLHQTALWSVRPSVAMWVDPGLFTRFLAVLIRSDSKICFPEYMIGFCANFACSQIVAGTYTHFWSAVYKVMLLTASTRGLVASAQLFLFSSLKFPSNAWLNINKKVKKLILVFFFVVIVNICFYFLIDFISKKQIPLYVYVNNI